MSSRDKKPSTSRTGGIRTLSDLNKYDSDSDGDAPQEYYTGGEKSGMLVQDPQRRNNDVDAIFEQARQMGAVQGPPEGLQTSSSSRSFAGAGRLLSGEPAPAADSSASSQGPQPIVHVITFWQNGFSVDDGPFRRIDDPANAPFLESIRKQECPKELEPKDRKTPVHVNLKKMDENFSEPETQRVSFQGVGRTLGSSGSSGTTPITTAPAPFRGLVVDRTLPSTSIQLRLLDGTRMVVHFNHHHTIADIRGFIDASRSMESSRAYQLQAVGFPPKILNDLSQTIEQAGLLNSVVIQKL